MRWSLDFALVRYARDDGEWRLFIPPMRDEAAHEWGTRRAAA